MDGKVNSTSQSLNSNRDLRELLEAAQQALAVDVAPLRVDLGHMRDMLQSAMGQLQSSFFGLDAQVQAQTLHVRDLFSTIEKTQVALRKELLETRTVTAELRRMLGTVLEPDARHSFQALPTVSTKVDTMLAALARVERHTEERLERMEQLAKEVRENVNGAIRALQFEDMATQLIDCAQRRVERLERVAACLEQIGPAESPATAVEPANTINELAALLGKLRVQVESPIQSPVAKSAMAASDDIEFF
ncbi:MAG TPA: hypothetical protein VHM25_23120 [Polyangiaceae bacterium]|jgi:methyl-accepting chemotaxis protein|nr:hypothetical protein [Polyangiaceae bacterium]